MRKLKLATVFLLSRDYRRHITCSKVGVIPVSFLCCQIFNIHVFLEHLNVCPSNDPCFHASSCVWCRCNPFTICVVVVKPFFLFVSRLFCTCHSVFKIECCGRRVRIKNLANATPSTCSGPCTTSNYSEPRSHESFVINSLTASPVVNGLNESDNANSHKSVLGTSVGKNSHSSTLNL